MDREEIKETILSYGLGTELCPLASSAPRCCLKKLATPAPVWSIGWYIFRLLPGGTRSGELGFI